MADDTLGGGRDNDLVLPPNTYAYVLDSTKGKVSVYVGPYKNSLSNTDQLVVWDARRNRFANVREVEEATAVFQMAGEGQYIVLSNPAARSGDAAHPVKGTSTEATDLDAGRKINVPGPATFALWPGQTAETIEGHHLRHNQYLVVRVYDAALAKANWSEAVVAPQVSQAAAVSAEATGTEAPGEQTDTEPAPEQTPAEELTTPVVSTEPPEFAMGQLIIIEGNKVSFYIPPTGIEVVRDELTDSFVREAVTLERLEYCILLDENGEKRYLQGPDVVFPSPTEKFVSDGPNRKFRAIELNDHSGLYIKVIAEYDDDDGHHPVGEELFITGANQAIYFPRAEHSIIQYGAKQVHYAVAIPAGEGRYVLNRDEGTVNLVRGPKMFLPDPRKEVVVLRMLDPHVVELLYPGNDEARQINEQYHQLSARLTPGDHLTSSVATRSAAFASEPDEAAFQGDTIRRGTSYTPPRSIVLDTKYEGAVAVNIWPGYAVLVTDKTDHRRVEVGPKMVLLQYDEMIMPLELSTGRPKDDRHTLRTAYLRIINNQVGDRVEVETRDAVKVSLDISYRVNFEGNAQQKWFILENYVKVLTDHCRSRLRNAAKRYGIQEFYAEAIDIIRDTLLGEVVDGSRSGLLFDENGMRLYDVEVLDVSIRDGDVAVLLARAQSEALSGAIRLSQAEEQFLRTRRLEEIARDELEVREETAAQKATVALLEVERQLENELAKLASQLTATRETQLIEDERLEGKRKATEQDLDLEKARNAVELERLVAETAEKLRLIEAVNSNMAEVFQQFGDKQFVQSLLTAMGPAAMAAGVTTADLLGQLFGGTPFEGVLQTLAERPLALSSNGSDNGSPRRS